MPVDRCSDSLRRVVEWEMLEKKHPCPMSEKVIGPNSKVGVGVAAGGVDVMQLCRTKLVGVVLMEAG